MNYMIPKRHVEQLGEPGLLQRLNGDGDMAAIDLEQRLTEIIQGELDVMGQSRVLDAAELAGVLTNELIDLAGTGRLLASIDKIARPARRQLPDPKGVWRDWGGDGVGP